MNLKVVIAINGQETNDYDLQSLVTDIENGELLIMLKNKTSQNDLS